MTKVTIIIGTPNQSEEKQLSSNTIAVFNNNFIKAKEALKKANKKIEDLEAKVNLMSLHSYVMGEMMDTLSTRLTALENANIPKEVAKEEVAAKVDTKANKA